MLQDLRPTLIILHIPRVTEQDTESQHKRSPRFNANTTSLVNLQDSENHYDESCHRKFYIDSALPPAWPQDNPDVFSSTV